MEFRHTNRVIILVDMDCFYCQVEENLDPKLRGKPIAVVQYNPWQGGGIIAVNYAARNKGVTRHMRGNEAKAKCPDINLVSVPCIRGKADISKYRDAGKKVADVLQMFADVLERASIDEAYMDITNAVEKRIGNSTQTQFTVNQLQNTHVIGYDIEEFVSNINENNALMESNLKLLVGGIIAEEVRASVYEKTGYRCSAGIAHNKILAKLACGMHKPNQQTILPQDSIVELYENLPVKKIRNLGGKFGLELTEDLGIKTMGELIKLSEKELIRRYDEKTGSWLYKIARGIDLEPVTNRLVSKSIGCCKKFPGRTALIDPQEVQHWLNELAEEICERLNKDAEENNRKAKQIIISFTQEIQRKDVSGSRTQSLNSYEPNIISANAYEVIKKNCVRPDGNFRIKFLGISASKFEDNNKKLPDISSYFVTKSVNKTSEAAKEEMNNFEKDGTNDSNSSVFSAETEVLSGDEERELLQEDSDADSISNEISCPYQINNQASTSKPASYFADFFTNLTTDKSPVERNFNTSLHLEQEADSEDSVTNEENDSEINNGLESCAECHKMINKSEFTAHTDYHFALKLAQEEAPVCKNSDKKSASTVAKKMSKKSSKRKFSDDKCVKLTEFLRPIDADDLSETCSECNRKIPVAEMDSHLDYHVAKRLHLEINPVKTLSFKINGGKVNAKNHKMPSVSTFFKPV